MNCWIILLLLCCCGKNNGTSNSDVGCGCDCDCHEYNDYHEHCHNSCIQPRMWEKDTCNVRRERDCDEYNHDHTHTHNEGCACSGEERVKEKWMPYTEYNDNDRKDCNCK